MTRWQRLGFPRRIMILYVWTDKSTATRFAATKAERSPASTASIWTSRLPDISRAIRPLTAFLIRLGFFRGGGLGWTEEERRRYIEECCGAQGGGGPREGCSSRARRADARIKWETASEANPLHKYILKKGLSGGARRETAWRFACNPLLFP